MNETTNQDKQEGQKTVVAFIVGLLVGGLLVWVFSGNDQAPVTTIDVASDDVSDSATADVARPISTSDEDDVSATVTPQLPVGDARVDVNDQPAGDTVSLQGATFPTSTGWIGVRSYANGQLGSVLGVALYSQAEGLVPEEITLLSPTRVGNDYAIVFYTEDGDRQFNLASDVQIDTPLTSFTAR